MLSALPSSALKSSPRSPQPRVSSDRELLQEPQIVFVEQPDVVDAVLQHGDALEPEAERETGDLLRVVADGLEDGWMHHAAAKDLEPPRVLAGPAARAGAALATDVDLGARLGVREEARTEADADVPKEVVHHRF